MRNVDGREIQVLDLILVDEPFQRHRVPHNLVRRVGTGFPDGLLHVVEAFGIVAPSLVLHEMVAETAGMYDDLVLAQVLERLDDRCPAFLMHHTMGKQVNDRFSIITVLMVEVGFHTEDQVRLVVFQVPEGVQRRLQLDDIGNVKPLEHHLQKVDVIAVGFTVLVQEGVGPQVPGILIDQRALYGEDHRAVVLCLCRHRCQHPAPNSYHQHLHHRGYPHPEGRALPFAFRFHADPAATLLADGLADTQSQTRSLHIVVQLYKAFEHFLLVFLRNAGSRILAVDADTFVLLCVAHFDMSLLGVFHGIGHEVGDHLLYTARVEMCGERLVGIVLDKLHLRVLHTFCGCGTDIVEGL